MINHVPEMYNLRGQTVSQFGLDCTGNIEYCFNQQGFRSNVNFDRVPQCVLFGCSSVFGIGVDYTHTTASLIPDCYNLGLAGKYNNNDIHQTIVSYLDSELYSPKTKLCVVWADRDQDIIQNLVTDLNTVNLYHFFCGDVVPGQSCFKFVKNLDHDVSHTHMGPKTHAAFAKMLWVLFNQF